MTHEPSDCNGGHGCAGEDCCCPCHYQQEGETCECGTNPARCWEQEADGQVITVCKWCARCDCGSGLPRRELCDARGIFVASVCDRCVRHVRNSYRDDIFTDPNYWTDEPIDED